MSKSAGAHSPEQSTVTAGRVELSLLAAEGLHKSYQMGRAPLRVLTDCSLRVAAGEFVAIRGKSGSGKSTLLHVLGALDVPNEGQVFFRGQPIFAPARQRRLRTSAFDAFSSVERRRIALRRSAFGFVFQFYHLLPELTVLENVLLTRMIASPVLRWGAERRPAREAALRILARVGLSERLRHRPSELSGGERQRVAIARALVHAPEVLFADEPTGNLDAETGRTIMALLKELHREGQTLVLVTHDPSIAEYADRSLVLEGGCLRAE